MALGTLGSMLLLTYQEPGSDQMWIRSYNTASYSVLHGVKTNGDTCQNTWSKSKFPVAHFSYHHGRTIDEPDPLTRAYSGRAPFAIATLDGVLHLVHQDSKSSNGIDVTFSNAGVMTAKNPVCFSGPGSAQPPNTCPGWGTLAESGWSRQQTIPEVDFPDGRQIAMCRAGSTLILVYQSEGDNLIQFSVARYTDDN